MYIAVTGNIGSGKTTLTEMLAQRCGMKTYYEDSNNPYIGDFYEDMNRWSFNLQIYFLGSRIRQAVDILRSGENLVQDRTIYEDAYIFADNLHQMGLMATRDYETYLKIFELANHLIPVPDVMIYLKASVPTLVNQITKRGRGYEMSIEEDYLERLNRKYNNWVENIYQGEVITVDVDTVNFVDNPHELDFIVERIEEIRRR